jgi:ABC-2 type transport system ATP-binding protein
MILLDGTLLTADALKEKAEDTTLRLSAVASEEAIRNVVKGINGVRTVSADPGGSAEAAHYLITAEPRPSIAAELLTALVGAGIAVSGLSECRPDLERVFLDLTRRSSRAAA